MNIIQRVQQVTGQAPVHKVNPNTQTPEAELHDNSAELLSQGAIPVALMGLYKYTRDADHAQKLVGGNISTSTNWSDELFGRQAAEITRRVADYAHVGTNRAQAAINSAADSAITIARNEAGSHATGNSIATFFKTHRTEILQYLPPALQLGYIINDNTIDDRTNKMEGPVSGLMHSIENIFSDSDANNSTKQ